MMILPDFGTVLESCLCSPACLMRLDVSIWFHKVLQDSLPSRMRQSLRAIDVCRCFIPCCKHYCEITTLSYTTTAVGQNLMTP